MEFDTIEQLNTVIKEIEPITEELKVYGVYKKGKTV
jgi:prephenate dehydratase